MALTVSGAKEGHGHQERCRDALLVIRISGINDRKVYSLEAMKESFTGSGLSLNSLTTFEGEA